MSILSFLIAVLLEQACSLKKQHSFHLFFLRTQRFFKQRLDCNNKQQAWLIWFLTVMLPSILVSLVYWLMAHFIGWFAALCWQVLVLYGCIGFKPFNDYFNHVRASLALGQQARINALLAQGLSNLGLAKNIEANILPARSTGLAMKLITLLFFRQFIGLAIFFMLFASLGLGPFGAVLFMFSHITWFCWGERKQQLTVGEQPSNALMQVSNQAWFLISWLPSRLTALFFCAVGNFESAYTAWRAAASENPKDCESIVVAAAAGALNLELENQPLQMGLGSSTMCEPLTNVPNERALPDVLSSLASLIWRVVVLCLALLVMLGMIKLVAAN